MTTAPEPTVYEYVQDGEVIDRVQPVPLDRPDDAQAYESTRLAAAVLDAEQAAARGELGDHWRIAGQPITNAERVDDDPPATSRRRGSSRPKPKE